jgi:hypothetical protein
MTPRFTANHPAAAHQPSLRRPTRQGPGNPSPRIVQFFSSLLERVVQVVQVGHPACKPTERAGFQATHL